MDDRLEAVRWASAAYHRSNTETAIARALLRKRLRAAETEYKLGQLAEAAGLTSEGVRYLLGRQKGAPCR